MLALISADDFLPSGKEFHVLSLFADNTLDLCLRKSNCYFKIWYFKNIYMYVYFVCICIYLPLTLFEFEEILFHISRYEVFQFLNLIDK